MCMLARMAIMTAMPTSFSKGTTVIYTRTISGYPASGGWSLAVHIAGKSKLSKGAVASGDSFVVTLTAADTDTLAASNYTWLERATNLAGEVYDVATGIVAVTPNVATAAAGDLQSWEEKALEIVEAALLASVGSNLVSYQIHGRSAVTVDRNDAIRFRDSLVRRIQRRRNGGKIGQTIHVAFRRP